VCVRVCVSCKCPVSRLVLELLPGVVGFCDIYLWINEEVRKMNLLPLQVWATAPLHTKNVIWSLESHQVFVYVDNVCRLLFACVLFYLSEMLYVFIWQVELVGWRLTELLTKWKPCITSAVCVLSTFVFDVGIKIKSGCVNGLTYIRKSEGKAEGKSGDALPYYC